MRISNRQIYASQLEHMNTSLSNLMESNNQGGTGKRVNRPSDDPASMGRILTYRSSLSDINRHKANIGEAASWLNLVDQSLMQVDEVITKIKTLSLQGATGTYNGDNRDEIGSQLRELMGNLLNLANTTTSGGQHVFAGHKTSEAPFVMELGITNNDQNLDGYDFVVKGGSSTSVSIQFVTVNGGVNPIYSTDGGRTWLLGEVDLVNHTIKAGGVSVEIYDPSTAPPTLVPPLSVATPLAYTATAAGTTPGSIITENPNDKIAMDRNGGTWITARPAVVYRGDENKIEVTRRYNPPGAPATETSADGYFTRDIVVRIDDTPPGGDVKYSYSLDNGSTWTQALAPNGATELPVPGGFLKLEASGPFTKDQQFIIHPHRADINFEIAANQTVTVNKVGMEIFGGMFKDPFDLYATPVNGGKTNLFETVGRLIGFAEENDQQGFGEALDELTDCLKLVGVHLADVGGRENRVEVAFQTLTIRELSEYDAMSSLENIDTVELMTRLAQQQLSYNTVLKSSAMIMQMSLMNFI